MLLHLQRRANLGASFDEHMNLQQHVSSIVKFCNWQLQRIGQIRKFLTLEADEKLIHAFISSRLLLLLLLLLLNGLAPAYLSQFLHPYSTSHKLRSNSLLLKVPKTRTKNYGDRAFQTATPKLWNSLPLCIRQSHPFKTKLKHHLLKETICKHT